jgi:hypothetical protein
MISDQGGGTLNNSIIRIILTHFLIMCCSFSTACATDLSKGKIECVKNILNSKIVKVDNKNQRLFIVNKNLTPELLSSKLSNIQLCLENSTWNSDWAISVFSEEKCAGYKDEKKIIPFHQNNEWEKAYKIEYLNSSGTIIKNPAISPEEIKP